MKINLKTLDEEEEPMPSEDIIKEARGIARRLIRSVRKHGCTNVTVTPIDGNQWGIEESQAEHKLVDAIVSKPNTEMLLRFDNIRGKRLGHVFFAPYCGSFAICASIGEGSGKWCSWERAAIRDHLTEILHGAN